MIGVADGAGRGAPGDRPGGRSVAEDLRIQRRVVAVRELGPDADPGDVLREADSPQVDVALVDQVIDAGVDADLGEQGLRQLVGKVAVIEPDGSIQPRRTPASGDAPVAALTGVERSPSRGEPERRREELPLRTVENEVDRAGVRAAFRVAELLPFPEVLRPERKSLGELRGRGDLAEWPKQLLRFHARRSEALLQVEGALGEIG